MQLFKRRRPTGQILVALQRTRLGPQVSNVDWDGDTLCVLFQVTDWRTRTSVHPIAQRQVLTYLQALRDLDLRCPVRLSGTYRVSVPRFPGTVRLQTVVDVLYSGQKIAATDWRVVPDEEAWRLAEQHKVAPIVQTP